ncbi:DNA-binding transcription factor yap1 [Mortierella sp. AD094]|nr:DNA-binding transcription factor yap1 [Mortierella sp. AD094]
MNSGHYSNQDLSYTDDDDESMVFQDHHDDVDMSYNSYPSNNANNNNNNNGNNRSFNSTTFSYLIDSYSNNPGQGNYNYNNSNNVNNNSSSNGGVHADQTTEKIRKKPGRKPGPSCPALRKEQNRAAQRAFRDRKERHLQQLENMIKDLKNQHFLVTSAYQREVRQLKAAIESLQSENYYLREVVFAFEAALSKGNHISILKEVKQELFRRHYESRAAASSKLAGRTASSPVPETPTSSVTPGTPNSPPASTPVTPATPPTASMASPNTPPAMALRSMSPTPPASSSSSYNHPAPSIDSNDELSKRQNRASDKGIYSLNGDILYKAPPLFIPEITDDGKLAPPTMFSASLSVPRPAYRPPGTNLPKHTEYTKHPTVFDELQSSLFPPGTLESLQINMATPQEVVSDDSLFAEPLEEEETYSTILPKKAETGNKMFAGGVDTNIIKIEDGDENEEFFRKVAVTLGMEKESVPRHRLHKEFRILASAPPQCDPNIDPNIYQLPHDCRIDYVPCPKLRAQMIVHQHRYNADELFQLLIDEAICHGSPLRKDSWQLPDSFFDRFGFLLGPELDRIRNKTWPPKRTDQ